MVAPAEAAPEAAEAEVVPLATQKQSNLQAAALKDMVQIYPYPKMHLGEKVELKVEKITNTSKFQFLRMQNLQAMW